VQNDPELIEGFTRAMLRGVADTLADPDEAYEISKKYVEGLDDSRRDVLESSLELWDAETLGYTEAATWDRTQEILLEMGLLDEPIENLEAAYNNDFIQNSQP
jgi:NitT/TauT family transport system substrate-binding protein